MHFAKLMICSYWAKKARKKKDIPFARDVLHVSNRENMKFLLCSSTKSLVEFDRTLNFRKLGTDLRELG